MPTQTPKSKFASKLSATKKMWGKAREKYKTDPQFASGYTPPPDGSYTARITSLTLGQTKEKGLLQIITQMVIVKGEQAGAECRTYNALEPEDRLPWAMKLLETLGVDMDTFDIENIETTLAELTEAKPFVAITVKTREGQNLPNVYVNRLVIMDESEIETSVDAAVAEAEAAAAESETPAEEPSEDAGEAPEGTVELTVGMSVLAPYEASEEKYPGTVSSISDDGSTVEVAFEDGSVDAAVPVASLEFVEDAAGTEENAEGTAEPELVLEVGGACRAPYEGEYFPATIKKVDAKTGKVTVQFEDGVQVVVAKDELQAAEAESEGSLAEEAVELKVGDAVSFTYQTKKYDGKVVALNDADGTVSVKPTKPIPGVKAPTVKVSASDVEAIATPAGKE